LEEIEKGPLLTEAVAGVGFTPEIAFEQKGFGAAIDTPDAVVAATSQGKKTRRRGFSHLREERKGRV
jgi:hypothetical protein